MQMIKLHNTLVVQKYESWKLSQKRKIHLTKPLSTHQTNLQRLSDKHFIKSKHFT